MPVCLPTRYLTSDVSGNLSFNASPAEWRLEHLHHRDGVRVPIYHTDDAQQISNSIHRGNLISVLLIWLLRVRAIEDTNFSWPLLNYKVKDSQTHEIKEKQVKVKEDGWVCTLLSLVWQSTSPQEKDKNRHLGFISNNYVTTHFILTAVNWGRYDYSSQGINDDTAAYRPHYVYIIQGQQRTGLNNDFPNS